MGQRFTQGEDTTFKPTDEERKPNQDEDYAADTLYQIWHGLTDYHPLKNGEYHQNWQQVLCVEPQFSDEAAKVHYSDPRNTAPGALLCVYRRFWNASPRAEDRDCCVLRYPVKTVADDKRALFHGSITAQSGSTPRQLRPLSQCNSLSQTSQAVTRLLSLE
jgi:hypothetical protein